MTSVLPFPTMPDAPRRRRRQPPQRPADPMPADVLSATVAEATAYVARQWCIARFEQYDGAALTLILAGNGVSQVDSGAHQGEQSAMLEIDSPDVAEAFGRALIVAAEKARALGLGAAAEATG